MKFEVDRCLTGISGLDELLMGGIPKNSAVVVTGTPGTAKTILTMQFLVNGAMKYNEKGVYISLEENIDDLIEQFMEFGYDLKKLADDGKISLVQPDINVEEGDDVLKEITDGGFIKNIVEFDAKRIVIDALNPVLQFSSGYGGERRGAQKLIDTYKKLGCTTLFIHERNKGGPDVEIEYETHDFLCDGIIYLDCVKKAGIFDDKKEFFNRRISILKMRRTAHGQGIYPFRIQRDGIHITPRWDNP